MEKLRQQIEQRLSAVTGDACFLLREPGDRRVASATRLTSP